MSGRLSGRMRSCMWRRRRVLRERKPNPDFALTVSMTRRRSRFSSPPSPTDNMQCFDARVANKRFGIRPPPRPTGTPRSAAIPESFRRRSVHSFSVVSMRQPIVSPRSPQARLTWACLTLPPPPPAPARGPRWPSRRHLRWLSGPVPRPLLHFVDVEAEDPTYAAMWGRVVRAEPVIHSVSVDLEVLGQILHGGVVRPAFVVA